MIINVYILFFSDFDYHKYYLTNDKFDKYIK